MHKHSSIALITCLSLSLLVAGCANSPYGNQRPLTRTEQGAIIGAVTGAALGYALKKKKGAVLVGAVGGGLAGAAVGQYMDRQRQDLQRVLSEEIQRGEAEVVPLQDNVLRVTMTDQTAFDVDSAKIKTGFYSTMDKLSRVLNQYRKTHLTIIGHTDSTGTDSYNQDLSLRRANAVQQYLLSRNVIPERLDTLGRGESEPRAGNDTAQGRQLNRRVEILVTPIVAGQ